jgi:hypothetical protein
MNNQTKIDVQPSDPGQVLTPPPQGRRLKELNIVKYGESLVQNRM